MHISCIFFFPLHPVWFKLVSLLYWVMDQRADALCLLKMQWFPDKNLGPPQPRTKFLMFIWQLVPSTVVWKWKKRATIEIYMSLFHWLLLAQRIGVHVLLLLTRSVFVFTTICPLNHFHSSGFWLFALWLFWSSSRGLCGKTCKTVVTMGNCCCPDFDDILLGLVIALVLAVMFFVVCQPLPARRVAVYHCYWIIV